MKPWIWWAAAVTVEIMFVGIGSGSYLATGAFVALLATGFIGLALKVLPWLSGRHSRRLLLADCDYEQAHATHPAGDRLIALHGRYQPHQWQPQHHVDTWEDGKLLNDGLVPFDPRWSFSGPGTLRIGVVRFENGYPAEFVGPTVEDYVRATAASCLVDPTLVEQRIDELRKRYS